MTPFQERFGRWTVQVMTAWNNVVFELSHGRVGGNVPSGAPICLLTTTGRRSGEPRTVPLFCLPHDGRYVLVASNGGMSGHPAWYLNLLTEPRAVIRLRDEAIPVSARLAEDAEREELWPLLTAGYEHFTAYRVRTDREIPIVVLVPSHESTTTAS